MKETNMTLKHLWLVATVALMATPALAADKVHHLAIQVSDNSPEKMNTALGNAANATRYYAGKGEKVEIRIVAFSGGVNMLRTDKSPVLERLKSTTENLPNVTFEACHNTLEGMAKQENKMIEDIPLFPGAKVVPAGVGELIDLNEQGWTIIRP
jgi:intracellular sulfur oxidation DsrE/DsrF family protein